MVRSQLASSVHNWGLIPLHDLVFTPPGGWKIASYSGGSILGVSNLALSLKQGRELFFRTMPYKVGILPMRTYVCHGTHCFL